MRYALDELVAASDVAEMAGVAPAVVSNWQKRHEDYPRPLAFIGGRPIWFRPAIETWLRRHRAMPEKRREERIAKLRAEIARLEAGAGE